MQLYTFTQTKQVGSFQEEYQLYFDSVKSAEEYIFNNDLVNDDDTLPEISPEYRETKELLSEYNSLTEDGVMFRLERKSDREKRVQNEPKPEPKYFAVYIEGRRVIHKEWNNVLESLAGIQPGDVKVEVLNLDQVLEIINEEFNIV